MRKISHLLMFLLFSCLLCFTCFAEEGDKKVEPAEAGGNQEYFAVLADGKKIGHGLHARSVSDGKVITIEMMNMTLGRGGVEVTVSTMEKSIETVDGKPLGFESTVSASGNVQKMVGTVNEQGKMAITTSAGKNSTQEVVDFPAGALMLEGARLLGVEKGLTEGTSYEVKVFSAMMKGAILTKVNVGPKVNVDMFGKVVELTEVKIEAHVGQDVFKSVSYCDDNLDNKKMIMPMMGMNLEVLSCEKEFALSKNDQVDFVGKMLVKSPVELSDLKNKASVTYCLQGKEGVELKFPASDSQSVKQTKACRFEITVTPQAEAEGIKFPYAGKDENVIKYLKPSQYVESDCKEVAELAKRAVGDCTDAAQAAKRIESFVAGFISDKNLSVGYASAAEVAQSRQGDCSEHAVLCAAMCRAVGIPARVATGLVYVQEFVGQKNVFGGHAWTQVYIGDKWIDVDATKAPEGFGPGHITLAWGNGDPADFLGMVNVLGNFSIEKISVEDKK